MRTMHKSFEDKTVISIDVIDALEEGLKNLRNLNGRLRSPYPESRFWFPTDVELKKQNEETLVDDFAAVERCQVMLQRFKLTFKALSIMSRSVEAEMHRIVRKIRPAAAVLARGIKIIPDEVLALIMQNLYNEWGTGMAPRDKPEDMRLVCKRFKHVIDLQPSFKALLSTWMSRAEISRRVERIGTSVGLQLYFNDKHPNFSTFVDSVVPLADRWEDVSIYIRNGYGVRPACAKLSSLFLPRLKRFTFEWTDPRGHEEAEMIYSGWDAPNLVDVDCTNVVPSNLRHKSTIKSFTLSEAQSGDILDMAYFDRLSSVLDALSSLTSLHLKFNRPYFDTVDVKEVKGARLPNLRELDIYFDSRDYDGDPEDQQLASTWAKSKFPEGGKAIFEFVAQLETPLLRRIAITSNNSSYLSPCIAHVIEELSNAQTSNLHTFELTGENDAFAIEFGTLLVILDNPNIEGSVLLNQLHLYDEGWTYDGGYAGFMKNKTTHKLRKLHLTKCSLSVSTLQKLLELFIKSDYFPDFEEIVLTRCSEFTMESLRGMYGMEFVRFEH